MSKQTALTELIQQAQQLDQEYESERYKVRLAEQAARDKKEAAKEAWNAIYTLLVEIDKNSSDNTAYRDSYLHSLMNMRGQSRHLPKE